MKKILSFIFVLLFVFTFIDGTGVLAKEKFEYPITASSPEWKDFTTRDQMIAAIRIPEEILKDMTTEELVVALFEYPLLVNVYAYNNDDMALRMFEKDCDAFKELLTRVDAAVVLNKYFETITEDDFLGIKASEVFSSSEKIFGVLVKEKFEYPITTSSEEWKEFTTRDQMIAVIRIPEEILKDMTTEELVVALFEYPLLVNLVLYNDDEISLREFEIICDAYRELITRNDSAYVLQKYINNLEDEDGIQRIASEVLLNSKKIFNQSIVYEQKIIFRSKATLINIGYIQTPNSFDVLVFNISSMIIHNAYFNSIYSAD